MSDKKRRILVMLLLMALITAACSAPAEVGTSDEEPVVEQGEVVARVNGENLYEGPFERMMDRLMIMYEQQGMAFEGEEGDALKEQIKEQTLQQMIQQEVLIQQAQQMELAATDEEVEAELDEIRSQFESDEEYQLVLEQNQFTESELKDTLWQEITIEALLRATAPDLTVTEEEMMEYYALYEAQHTEQREAMEASGEELSEEEAAMMELPPYEELKEDIRAQLYQEREQEHQMAFINELMENSEIDILI